MTPKTRGDLMLQAGNVRIMTFWEGEGAGAQLRARIGKATAGKDNGAWTIEEIALMGKLCKEIVKRAMVRQSVDIAATEEAFIKKAEEALKDGPPQGSEETPAEQLPQE
jgi:hypothetical protein